jgi:hypothetical protein
MRREVVRLTGEAGLFLEIQRGGWLKANRHR